MAAAGLNLFECLKRRRYAVGALAEEFDESL